MRSPCLGHQTPQCEEIDEFHHADKTEANAEAKSPANVANDIFQSVQLISDILHCGAFLEVNIQQDIVPPANTKRDNGCGQNWVE